MKIRESGMPHEEMWEKFFEPERILSKLDFNSSVENAAEFGSGYGTFSLYAAKIIKGILFAFDIDDSMVKSLNIKAEKNDIRNIKVIQRDFVAEGTGLQNESVDYVMLFNILHAENPEILLNESYRILKKNGKAGVIHWIYSKDTPRGPSLGIRPTEKQCADWIREARFKLKGNQPISLPPYHYGLVGIK